MKAIINATQTILSTVTGLKYVDENWGQLDYYSPNPPVQFPCGLIDIINSTFSNIGMDKTANPMNRQMNSFNLEIRIADYKLTNSSGRAPQPQKDNARHIFDLIEDIHTKLQGFRPTTMCGKLVRISQTRVMREDGIREYVIIYSGDIQNV